MGESVQHRVNRSIELTTTSPVLSFCLAVPMLLWSLLMFSHGLRSGTTPVQWASAIVTIFMSALFFLMIKTGKVDVYRKIFFVTLGVLFPVGFITELIQIRGSMSLSMETILLGNTPFCHLALPMMAVPVALAKTIVFPGSILPTHENPNAFATMFSIWFGATLVMGRGWCSWGCFFGGLDEGVSSLKKRPVIKKINERWHLLPWAVLIVSVMATLILVKPFYCVWLCPFKVVTEFNKVENFRSAMQFGAMLLSFGTLILALPLLTGKRAQCGYFCPMGAIQSVTNYFNIFTVTMDKKRCNACKLCVRQCPLNALTIGDEGKPTPTSRCSRCGKCIDVCRSKAARWHVKGTGSDSSQRAARLLFLFPFWMFATMFGGSTIAHGLSKILGIFL